MPGFMTKLADGRTFMVLHYCDIEVPGLLEDEGIAERGEVVSVEPTPATEYKDISTPMILMAV